MGMTTVLGNITVRRWEKTELGLSSTKEIDSVKYRWLELSISVSKENGNKLKLGLVLEVEISAFNALGNGVSINTTFQWTHLGYTLIYGPRKGFGLENSGYRRSSRRRASARAWRSRSVDLEPLGGYQLSVGGEMRSGWPNLQTQIRKFQKRSDLENSKSDEGG